MSHLANFAAPPAVPSCNNARRELEILFASLYKSKKIKNDSALLCQTVDIVTGCLHSAQSYFKTVVSEEPNACYFCCLWAATLLDIVDSLSPSSSLPLSRSVSVFAQCLPAPAYVCSGFHVQLLFLSIFVLSVCWCVYVYVYVRALVCGGCR